MVTHHQNKSQKLKKKKTFSIEIMITLKRIKIIKWNTEIRNVYEYLFTCFWGVGATHLQTQRILQVPSWTTGHLSAYVGPLSPRVNFQCSPLIIFELSFFCFSCLRDTDTFDIAFGNYYLCFFLCDKKLSILFYWQLW